MAQGTIESFDPDTRTGSIRDDGGENIALANDALDASIFVMLRQGQRVNYDRIEKDGQTIATRVRIGHAGR